MVTSFADWVAGARPKTLPAAVVPVAVGTAAAVDTSDGWSGTIIWWRAAAALVVALALQVATNYANDYSDGIRGTDDDRAGPMRLVGSGAASPAAVKAAAFASFGVAGVVGLALAIAVGWELLVVGAAAIAAGWFYTGGKNPYGYMGLGEVFVFVFFGVVATVGSAYVQPAGWSLRAAAASVGVGALATALLVANNLRDIPTDAESGKRTLAVRLGDTRTRQMFAEFHGLAYAMVVVIAMGAVRDGWGTAWALLALVAVPLSIRAVRPVWAGATGRELIASLEWTGKAQLLYGLALAVGLWIG